MNLIKKINNTFKIKNTCFHSFSVIFSSMCSYFSAISWMILSKDLDRSRYVMNLRKWTTLLKLKNIFPQFFCHLQFYVLIFLCYIVNDIANIMMEYLTYLITILIVFETSLSEVILYLCLIWSHIKLQYLSTYQRWYLCLKKQICNEFKKMNDTSKIKNTCYQRVSVIFK